MEKYLETAVKNNKLKPEAAAEISKNGSTDTKFSWAVYEVLDDDLEAFLDQKIVPELLLLQLCRNTQK